MSKIKSAIIGGAALAGIATVAPKAFDRENLLTQLYEAAPIIESHHEHIIETLDDGSLENIPNRLSDGRDNILSMFDMVRSIIGHNLKNENRVGIDDLGENYEDQIVPLLKKIRSFCNQDFSSSDPAIQKQQADELKRLENELYKVYEDLYKEATADTNEVFGEIQDKLSGDGVTEFEDVREQIMEDAGLIMEITGSTELPDLASKNPNIIRGDIASLAKTLRNKANNGDYEAYRILWELNDDLDEDIGFWTWALILATLGMGVGAMGIGYAVRKYMKKKKENAPQETRTPLTEAQKTEYNNMIDQAFELLDEWDSQIEGRIPDLEAKLAIPEGNPGYVEPSQRKGVQQELDETIRIARYINGRVPIIGNGDAVTEMATRKEALDRLREKIEKVPLSEREFKNELLDRILGTKAFVSHRYRFSPRLIRKGRTYGILAMIGQDGEHRAKLFQRIIEGRLKKGAQQKKIKLSDETEIEVDPSVSAQFEELNRLAKIFYGLRDIASQIDDFVRNAKLVADHEARYTGTGFAGSIGGWWNRTLNRGVYKEQNKQAYGDDPSSDDMNKRGWVGLRDKNYADIVAKFGEIGVEVPNGAQTNPQALIDYRNGIMNRFNTVIDDVERIKGTDSANQAEDLQINGDPNTIIVFTQTQFKT